MNRYITVYGSSSAHLDPQYYAAAHEMGALIAKAGHTLVCGGGRAGLMASAIDGAREEGGQTIGILPTFMIEKGWGHPELGLTLPTPDMHTRKTLMATMASTVIALPGGIGTFDELFEIITWRQLGLWTGKIVILNTLGYYEPILAMLDKASEQGFMRKETDTDLYSVASTPAEAIAKITEP
ncbi:MAG: TIGR00730 family Rossman fold protein [Pseudoflavonifractor sp.]|nr:TIGR00730 family Rossman fold protein [Alloprevotella sp.]MCM1116919.1 TIGR00730 family Rossman fold protein [Pseudoflavonifractor sp.]